jgi:hypothetical protein
MRMFDAYVPDEWRPGAAANMATRRVVIQDRLNRVLAFTQLTIDDVVNNPIAKNQVLGYYKLSKQIGRSGEIGELERQWNPNGAG